MMAFRLVTGPASYPVTLAEAKAQCRVDSTIEDALINGLIAAAAAHVEQYIGRAIMAQTWELTADAWADEFILKGPVQSVTSIKYLDTASAEQTVSASLYELDAANDRVVFLSSFSAPALRGEVNDITVRFVAGFTATPDDLKLAVLLLIDLWYNNRSAASDRTMTPMPHAVDALLCNHRAFAC